MATTITKSLKDMNLNELILSQDSLANIVEDNELDIKLQDYVKNSILEENINTLQNRFSNYVQTSQYEDLESRFNELTLSVQALSSYSTDKDKLCGAIQTLSGALDSSEISIRIVDEYDAGVASAGVIYFVKSSVDNTLSTMYFTPKTNTNSENNNQEDEELPLKMQFTSIKSASTNEGTVKKGEAITIVGSNLLDVNDVPARYGLSVATFKQPSGMDATTPVIKTFVEVQNWPNDNEQHDGWTDFTSEQITLPASIWESTPLNAEFVNNGAHDSIDILLQKFKNDEVVDSANISATIENVQPMAMTSTRKRRTTKQ